MPILPFDSRHGYSVGATAVVDSLRNINAVGGTYTARVSMAGGVTASQLFVGGTITAGTMSATTYRNLPVATASVTGVASFDSSFTVSSAGSVSPRFFINSQFIGPISFSIFGRHGIQIVQNEDSEGNDVLRVGLVAGITGDTVVAGTNVGVSRSGKTVTVSSTHPLASASVTGVASFNNQFVVSAAGAVGLTSNYIISANSLTGAIEVSGSTGILVETIAASKRILVSLRTSNFNNATANITTFDTNTNSFVGVNGFNYDSGSGNLKIAGSLILADAQGNISFGDGTTQSTAARIRLASTTATGNASFNNVHFTVATTGHVSLASAYQVTGDTVVAGTNITISRSGNSVTVNSGGGGGSVPLATTSITGAASFNPSDFVVSATGNVSLTDVFTGGVTCNAAASVAGTLTAGSLFVSQGVTLNSRASLVGGATAANLFVGAGTTLNSSLYVGGNSTLGGATANTITLPSGQVVKTYLSTRTSTSEFVLVSEPLIGYSSADIVIQAEYYIAAGAGTNAVHSTRILLVADPATATAKHVQYGNVFIGATCASYDVDTDGANFWRLKATPTAASGISPCDFRAYAILSPNIGGFGL